MATSRSLRFRLLQLTILVLIGLCWYAYPAASKTEPNATPVNSQATRASARRPTLAKDFKPSRPVSRATYQAISNRLRSMQLRMAAQAPPVTSPHSIAADPATPSRQTSEPTVSGSIGPQFHGTPSTLQVGRNSVNNQANTNNCGTGNTLAEPAAANEGRNVYYTGNNRHQEFSTNGGATWTCAAAYPAGPTEAPTAIGDTDVVYDHSRGVTFHSVAYVNNTMTNAIIRLFVRRNIDLADNCFYDIDTDPSATNVIDDFPHLGLSNNFLYISASRVQAGSWLGAYMERDNLDELVDCGTVNFNFISFTNSGGTRILVPGQGARDVMYFAWVNTTSQWRVFSWADNSGTIFSTFIDVATMTFGDPDCRGGRNNSDWADAPSFGIIGFRARTTVGNDFVTVWTATAADSAHSQAHIHGAIFRIGASQTDLTLVQQPVIFNPSNCAGIPVPTVNDRGDIGMALAFGSMAGGGGSAVHTDVTMIDEFSPGPGGFLLVPIVTGTHNPTGRYGDYFTTRRNTPCGEWFDATGYALSGGTGLANVDARYAEFGRGRDAQCYLAWRDAAPAT